MTLNSVKCKSVWLMTLFMVFYCCSVANTLVNDLQHSYCDVIRFTAHCAGFFSILLCGNLVSIKPHKPIKNILTIPENIDFCLISSYIRISR